MNLRTALNALLTAPEFQALEEKLRSISAFHVLGIDRREISHASLLAWLLDPRASHGMGSAPLRKFMLMASSLATADTMIDATDVDALDLDVLNVETEVPIKAPGSKRPRRLDVLVSLPAADGQERGQSVLVVEYKVDADESEDQTADYAEWSRDQAFDFGDRKVLPLQVFLCPARGEGKEPAEPFVNLDYDSYIGWLDMTAQLDKTEQASFLLREFRLCLSQRADVTDEEQEQLFNRLSIGQQDSVAALKRAGQADLARFGTIFSKHEEVFRLLGVARSKRSKGFSPITDALRSACQRYLRNGLWRIRGSGSMNAIFIPMIERVREHIGDANVGMSSILRVHYYADRPEKDRCLPVLEVIGNLPGLDARAAKALRGELAASLRAHLPKDLMGNPGRGAIVFRLPILLPGVIGIAEDTEERANAVGDAINKVAIKAKGVEEPLTLWVKRVLPELLPATGARRSE